jgi:hypothetical protein
MTRSTLAADGLTLGPQFGVDARRSVSPIGRFRAGCWRRLGVDEAILAAVLWPVDRAETAIRQ